MYTGVKITAFSGVLCFACRSSSMLSYVSMNIRTITGIFWAKFLEVGKKKLLVCISDWSKTPLNSSKLYTRQHSVWAFLFVKGTGIFLSPVCMEPKLVLSRLLSLLYINTIVYHHFLSVIGSIGRVSYSCQLCWSAKIILTLCVVLLNPWTSQLNGRKIVNYQMTMGTQNIL